MIVAYLEKKYPKYKIHPLKSQDYADALWLEKYADTIMTNVIHKIFVERVVIPFVLKQEKNEEIVINLINNDLPKVFSYLNNWLEKHNSTYLVGESVTIADFSVANHLVSLEPSKIQWQNGQYPYLEKYFKKMKTNKVFEKSIPDILKNSF